MHDLHWLNLIKPFSELPCPALKHLHLLIFEHSFSIVVLGTGFYLSQRAFHSGMLKTKDNIDSRRDLKRGLVCKLSVCILR